MFQPHVTDNQSNDRNLQAVHNVSIQGNDMVTGAGPCTRQANSLHQPEQNVQRNIFVREKPAFPSKYGAVQFLRKLRLREIRYVL